MWSRMLKDAVMPTTQTTVKQASRITPKVPGMNCENSCARMPDASRNSAATGMPTKSFT